MTKKLMVLLLAFMVGSLFAETKSVLRIHFNDGSYKDYPVERVSQLKFNADPADPTVPDPKNEPYEKDPNYNLSSSSSLAVVKSSASKDDAKSSSSAADTKSSSSKAEAKSSSSKAEAKSSSSKADAKSSSSKAEDKSSSSAGGVKSSASKTLVVNQNSFGNVARWNAGSKVLSLESSENTKAEVYVFGPQGICLAKKKVLLIPGYNFVYFDDVNLARSVYIVRVKTASKDAILRIQDMK